MTTPSRTTIRRLALGLAAAGLLGVAPGLAQPMGPTGPDPRSMAPGGPAPDPAGRSPYGYAASAPGAPGGPAGAAYGPDPGYGPAAGSGYGRGYESSYGPGAAPRAHRRHRAHPVASRPECELGLHGCLGRDGLYHGKF